ncbi:MAG: hypothetical protein CSA49_00035 [Gammaproteobacteria bacterium]|nr:MAG: hypothetical protein CSA49_00035 [Gammaproteobacteria bacterium]
MYPDELATIQIAEYRKGHEDGSEHTRFGAFLWWISKLCCQSQYELLMKLSYLEPDKGMAEHVRARLEEQWHKPRYSPSMSVLGDDPNDQEQI